MTHDLTTSVIARRNILNNPFAIKETEKAIGLKGVPFENEYKLTKQQVAAFLGVSTRTISACIASNSDELRKSGYEDLSGNRLKSFKLAATKAFGGEVNFPTKTTRLTIMQR